MHEWSVPYRIGRAARFLPNGNIVVGCKDPEASAPFPFVSLSLSWCGAYNSLTSTAEVSTLRSTPRERLLTSSATPLDITSEFVIFTAS